MEQIDKRRFANVLEAVVGSKTSGLPNYIVASINEGLNILAESLVQTGFLNGK